MAPNRQRETDTTYYGRARATCQCVPAHICPQPQGAIGRENTPCACTRHNEVQVTRPLLLPSNCIVVGSYTILSLMLRSAAASVSSCRLLLRLAKEACSGDGLESEDWEANEASATATGNQSRRRTEHCRSLCSDHSILIPVYLATYPHLRAIYAPSVVLLARSAVLHQKLPLESRTVKLKLIMCPSGLLAHAMLISHVQTSISSAVSTEGFSFSADNSTQSTTVFAVKSTYSFKIRRQGRHFVRLHLLPFRYQSRDLAEENLKVFTQDVVVLNNFNFRPVVVMGYSLNITRPGTYMQSMPLGN